MKKVVFFCILFLLFFSCQKENKDVLDSKKELSSQEKLIENLFNQMVIRANLPKDSAQLVFQKIQHLDSEKPLFNSYRELILATYYRKEASYRLAISHYENALDKIDDDNAVADYAYVGLGISNKHLGNFPKALSWFQKSVQNCEKRNDTLRLSGAYASLAQLNFEKGDFKEAERYVNSVFDLLKQKKTSQPYLIALHNLANIELKKGNYKKAVQIDFEGLELANKINNDAVKVTFQDNLARCYLDYLNDYEKATFYFNENLKIDKKLNNLNWIADTYINLAEVETKKGNYTSAQNYIQDAIKIFDETKNLNNSLKAYAVLKELYLKQGNQAKALEANEEYLKLYRKHLNEKSEQAFVEYNTLFETQKKEQKLAETQLKLSKKEIESKNKSIWILVLLGITLVALFLIRMLRIKSVLKQKKLQLEISRELHDSLGSHLTFINSLSENLKREDMQSNSTKIGTISKLSDYSKNAISELKNTIWVLNSKDLSLNELKMKMLNYVRQASETQEEMRFDFDFEITSNKQLNSKQSINLFRVFQEISNNAMKYSRANNFRIRITQNSNSLQLIFEDNGIGFDVDALKEKSFGISNIRSRISELNGALTLESEPNRGTRYEISVKL